MGEMLRIGLPAGFQGMVFSLSNVLIQSSVNSFGSLVMAGNTAAANIEGFVYTTMNSIHQTTVNYVGQNTGAHKFDRVKKIFLTCLACVAVAGIAVSGITYIFGEQLLGIYITDSQQAIQYGLVRFTYVCLPYFMCGLMDVSTGALRGLGSSFTPMLICILGVCGIRIVWIFTVFQLPQFHTPEGLYITYPISWFVTFAAETVAFIILYKKKRKQFTLA